MSSYEKQEPISEPLPPIQEEAAPDQPEKPEESGKKKKEKVKKSWKRELLEWIITIVSAVVIAMVLRTFVFSPVKVDGASMNDTLQNKEIMLTTSYDYWLGEIQRFDVVICHYPSRGSTNFVKRGVGLPGDLIQLQDGYLYVNGERYEETYINNEYRRGYLNSLSLRRVPARGDVITWTEEEGFLVNGEASELGILYGIAEVTAKSGSDVLKEEVIRGTQGEISNAYFTLNGKTLVHKEGSWYLNGEAQAEDPISGREFVVTDDYYFVMGDHRNASNDSRSVGPVSRSYIKGHVRYVIWPWSAKRAITTD